MHASLGWDFSRNTWSTNARDADFSSDGATQLTCAKTCGALS